MPEALDRCVRRLMGEGNDEQSSFAICRASLGLNDDGSEDDKEFIRKRMVIARPVGKTERFGMVDKRRFGRLVKRYNEFPRQVPVFLLGDHVLDLDSRIPDGWVEGLEVNDDGDLVAMVKLLGQAAQLVLDDRIRGASIGTVKANNPDGSSQGEVLHHVLLTNQPFIKDLNIAAARIEGAETAVCMFTALDGVEEMDEKAIAQMKEENKELKERIAALEKKKTASDPELAAKVKEKEEIIVGLKADALKHKREIDSLNEQLANAKADPEKEEAVAKMKDLERQQFISNLRTVIRDGLERGTILASEVEGFAGSHSLDFAATEMWLKKSDFYDEALPNPEENAYQVIKHLATKTKPRVTIAARYQSGRPRHDDDTLTLTESEKTWLREHGYDPVRVAAMKDDTPKTEWDRLPHEEKK